MFNSTILDVAIGMIFVYLLLSLICSAAHEMIEYWLKKRASDLERGVRELLTTEDGSDPGGFHARSIPSCGRPGQRPARARAGQLFSGTAVVSSRRPAAAASRASRRGGPTRSDRCA